MKHILYFFVVLVQRLVRAGSQHCPGFGSQSSIYGWMLQGHIYKTMPSDLGLRCLVRCQADDRCQSFNFVLSRHMCEFSDRTKEASPKDFIPDPDRFYLTRMKDRVPLGSTPLLAAISCKEIKASEGEAVSGKYWLSGLKPNVMVFAFCDMKTEDVNECNSSPSLCDVNAQCTNTTCSCKPGFFGDGKSCQKKAFGRSCIEIKTTHPSSGDDLYWLDPEGGNQANAFLAYCDMTSYNGGWTMCYTTDEYAKPKSEVTYNPDFPYGVDGYRTNCNNISFTEIMFIDHQTGSKVYFKRKSNHPVKAAANYGKSGSALGLWDAVGASVSYSYQLLICDILFYSGFMVSGLTGNCYKGCDHWCSDYSSPYFRTASTSSLYKGVAFNTNGAIVLSNRLMSVGLR
ncbi:uncharacterized protein [Acropora muricata]|uniref:uncharacterized protein isoform X1 n=2 Tax=Acropora muricata TaxID=159855 RepID=UPI0034E3766B